MENEDDLSDEDWYLLKIQQAMTMDRLEYLALNIKYDTWEKVSYTQDDHTMRRIRAAWVQRKKQIENK